jgi:hypothetical protein
VVSKSKRAALEAESVDPSLVEGAIADGLLIARSAASIAVANRIIVRALREQKTFDREETRGAVRDELARLTREQRDLAARMVEARTKALKSKGRSRHQFDYRADDNTALASRETIYTTIATRLDALATDAAYVDEIVTAARDRAWNDIGSTIISHVADDVVVPDGDYGSHRDERLQLLLDIDLAALAAGAARGQSASNGNGSAPA